MNPKVDTYIKRSKKWPQEMTELRPILLGRGLTEEIKWGKPCYSHDGRNIAILQEMNEFLALMFFKGALLNDPDGVLEEQGPNSRSARRIRFTSVDDVARLSDTVKACIDEAIDIEESGLEVGPAPELILVDELQTRLDSAPALKAAFEALTPGRQREYNMYLADAKQASTREARVEKYVPNILSGLGLRDKPKPALLSGGNPQIAKAEGDAPVQAYIATLQGWKRDIGLRLDALIVHTVPDVSKAVKWNSPFYGIDGQGWFLGVHVFTNYIKVTFFQGTSLRPVPAGGKAKDARWINIHEGEFDEALMEAWVKQAAALPGWGKV